MLKECKLALRITTNAYDAELAGLMRSAAFDLGLAGIVVEGVSFTFTESTAGTVVTDTSTLDDPILMRAIFTYVRARFGSPDDYDRQKAAYDEMKAQLQVATGYGFPDEDDEEDDTE